MSDLYKHTNNTTVAIEVIKRFYVKETGILKLKVKWWNIGDCHAPWDMGIVQSIQMTKEKWKEWNRYATVHI